jgi:hypothetical protein
MNSWQRSHRRTARKIGFIAFCTLAGGGVCYITYQMLVDFGLDWRMAAIVAGFVFICMVIFATRHEPR